MHVMILAAGLGTRLAPITDTVPKPLVPVVGAPTIVLHIQRLARFGFRDIVINTHHLAKALQEALGDGARWGVKITYSHEPVLLGTGGGIKKALPLLGNEDFLVVNADALFAPDYEALLDAHDESGALATMLVRRTPEARDYGAVRVDPGGTVRSIIGRGAEDPTAVPTMFTGVHVLTQEFARRLPESGCIIRKSYLPALEEGGAVRAVFNDGYFCDLGTPERYLRANLDLVAGRVRLEGLRTPLRDIYVGANVDLSASAELSGEVILCDGCRVAPMSRLRRCLVMPGARVRGEARDCIVFGDDVRLEIAL